MLSRLLPIATACRIARVVKVFVTLIMLWQPAWAQQFVPSYLPVGPPDRVSKSPFTPHRDTIHFYLPANQRWYRQPWKDSVYEHRGFREGKFYFDTGFSPSHTFLMNYNSYLETVDLIDQKGDTMVLKRFPYLKVITIGTETFFYEPNLGYIQVLMNDKVALGSKRFWGTVVVNSSGRRYSTGQDIRGPVSSDQRYYFPGESLYLIDPRNRVHRVGPNAFLKLFPAWEYELRAYMESNQIDYHNRTQVAHFLKYCNQLGNLDDDASALLRMDDGGAWEDSVYRFQEFRKGEVMRKATDGSETTSEELLNYHLVTGSMQRIYKGDTVSLDVTQLSAVQVGEHLFVRDVYQGYIEVLLRGRVSLGMQRKVSMLKTSVAQLTDSVSRYARSRNAGDQEVETLYRKEDLFFIMKGDRVLRAGLPAITWAFPGHKSQITEYVKKNRVNFRRKEDMIRLMSFCAQL